MPEEYGSEVIQTVEQFSAVEAVGRRVNMTSNIFSTPRLGDVDVVVIPKGGTYPEDQPQMDDVELKAAKFANRVIVAEEDLADANVNVIVELQKGWATNYARKFDNACLGTTAVANGVTVPFTSVYKEAGTAVIKTAGALTYADVSEVLGLAENGRYFADPDTIVIAHTSFKGQLRGLVDGNGRPLFIDQVSATQPATLFGYEIRFSDGAKTSATAQWNPTGNPLLIVGNRKHLIVGDRSPIESLISFDAGYGTDEPHIKMRTRKAFAVGRKEAFGVLEVTSA
ncbi:phage major capsid protein [Rhodococcus sp. IEGM 1401]|uniref:phage major capsid protein n=1 Tax=unclassified Rhodococcus (in: high G+C Gram-positive bacteria) TaxID=192944 RepID=UPI0022B3C43B|nr:MULTISPECIES: phage major capsid protein [unclassified Rhodococcus (in: high G+C Gram-positive bacteria)]MCZ4563127.1 phage major capsid protein [Rhodococcus sp. IEGM 1401]MDI9923250.1 phage major capsid protein [Rhodococcus sp. IEGM 1372]MDV8035746.1 phage major capsid protein [Rhodococcus sp. IEGM 1414]